MAVDRELENIVWLACFLIPKKSSPGKLSWEATWEVKSLKYAACRQNRASLKTKSNPGKLSWEVQWEVKSLKYAACRQNQASLNTKSSLREAFMRGAVAEVRSLPTKSSLREAFMRGAIAEVRSLPTKSSLRELAHLFHLLYLSCVFESKTVVQSLPSTRAGG